MLFSFCQRILAQKSEPAKPSQLREPWIRGTLDELYCSYSPCYEKAGQMIMANTRARGSCFECGKSVSYGRGAGLSFRDGQAFLVCTNCADKIRKQNRKINNCAICGKPYLKMTNHNHISQAQKHYDEGLNNLCKCQANKSSLWYGEAIREFTKAIEENNLMVQAYAMRRTCYLALGDQEKASADTLKIQQLETTEFLLPQTDRQMAEAYLEKACQNIDAQGLISDSLFYLQKAIDADATYANTFDTRFDVYTTLGMIDEALVDIEHAGRLRKSLQKNRMLTNTTQKEWTNPAGFWLRFIAFLVDLLVLAPVSLLVFGVAVVVVERLTGMNAHSIEAREIFNKITGGIFLALWWPYFALMEAFHTQGTLGKMLLGLKVTDLEGNRISFGKASGRFFGKSLSMGIIFVGFLMAGLTSRKQGLHDIISNCIVIKK